MKYSIFCKKTLAMAAFSMAFVSCSKQAVVNTSIVEDIPTVQKFKEDKIPDQDIEKIVKAGINSQSGMNMQPWHFTVITNKEILDEIGAKLKASMGNRPGKFPGKAPDMKDGKIPPMGKPDGNFPPAGEADGKFPPMGAPDGKFPPEGKFPPKFGAKAGMGDSPVAILVSAKDGADFDAGLATEMMTVQAALLGYGTKIVSSPTIVLNGEEKEEYKKSLGIPDDMSAKAVILVGYYDKAESDAVTGATPRKAAGDVVNYVK